MEIGPCRRNKYMEIFVAIIMKIHPCVHSSFSYVKYNETFTLKKKKKKKKFLFCVQNIRPNRTCIREVLTSAHNLCFHHNLYPSRHMTSE